MGHIHAQPFVRLRTDVLPRRKFDVSQARERFGFESRTPFEEGCGGRLRRI